MTPIETPNIFAPVSTPAFAIRDLSFIVLAITAATFLIVAGFAVYTLIRFRPAPGEPTGRAGAGVWQHADRAGVGGGAALDRRRPVPGHRPIHLWDRAPPAAAGRARAHRRRPVAWRRTRMLSRHITYDPWLEEVVVRGRNGRSS